MKGQVNKMRRAARGYRKYKDKAGNYIFLTDIVSKKKSEFLDENKLPAELKDCADIGFVWADEISEYILCVKKEYLQNLNIK